MTNLCRILVFVCLICLLGIFSRVYFHGLTLSYNASILPKWIFFWFIVQRLWYTLFFYQDRYYTRKHTLLSNIKQQRIEFSIRNWVIKIHDHTPNKNVLCCSTTGQYLAKFDSVPGHVMSQGVVVTGITSANLCAKKCYESTTSCKSFEYCDSTKQCTLMTTHRLNLPPGAIKSSSVCSLYSSTYDIQYFV
jgi:hypothetical protein